MKFVLLIIVAALLVLYAFVLGAGWTEPTIGFNVTISNEALGR